MVDFYACLSSRTVRALHLEYYSTVNLGSLQMFLQRILPNFPNLRNLSLDVKEGAIQFESLSSLCRTEISITQRRPEFFQLPKWEGCCGSHNLSLGFYVM